MPSPVRPDFGWHESDDRTVMSGRRPLPSSSTGPETAGRTASRSRAQPSMRSLGPVESDPERDAPARVVSPVYQEIHRHELAGQTGLCCLLTGSCFSIISRRLSPCAADADQPGTLLARHRRRGPVSRPVESLAATYLVTMDSQRAGRCRIRTGSSGRRKPGPGRLELTAPIRQRALALAEAGRQATRVQVLAAIQPATFTHRLRYRWRWTSASSLTR